MAGTPRKREGQRCTATAKSTGKRCRALAEPGWTVCRLHGYNPKGKPPGNPEIWKYVDRDKARERMMGNSLGILHGALTKKILTEEEWTIYDEIKARLRVDYDLDDAADEVILHMLGFSAAKLYTSQRFGIDKGVRRYTKEINEALANLGIQRRERFRLQQEGSARDPQEYTLAFLDRMKKQVASLPPSGPPRIIDVEATDVGATARTQDRQGGGTGVPGDRPLEAKNEDEE